MIAAFLTCTGTIIRRIFWPLLMAIVTRISFARNRAFRFMSQVHISYAANSVVSQGQTVGTTKPGDRVPWVEYEDGSDNHDSFDPTTWQLQVYGDAPIDLQELKWIKVQRYPFTKRAKQVGLSHDCVLLVRPDTYIGLALKQFDIEAIRGYARQWALKP